MPRLSRRQSGLLGAFIAVATVGALLSYVHASVLPMVHFAGSRATVHDTSVHSRRRRRRRLVFIYDWPQACRDLGLCREATADAARALRCAALSNATWRVAHRRDEAACAANHGYGAAVGSSSAYDFATPQFSAGALFEHRLLHSEWRTMDPSAAALFFIPFDILLDVHKYKLHWLLNTVLASPQFKRRGGSDHFIVHSYMRIDGVDAAVFDGALANVTKLTIENYCYAAHEYDALGRSVHVSSRTALPSRWAAVPYPSFFHPSASFHVSEWDALVKRKDALIFMALSTQVSPTVGSAANQQLTRVTCGAAAERKIGVANSSVNVLRRALLHECAVHADVCRSHVLTRRRNSTEMPLGKYDAVIRAMRTSRYCLVPPGDTPTSKRFFDAVAAGCVPIPLDAALWNCIYALEPFASHVRAITSAHASLPRRIAELFRWLRNDNGSMFNAQLPVLRDMVMSMSYAIEEHPSHFDVVDVVVDRLLVGNF